MQTGTCQYTVRTFVKFTGANLDEKKCCREVEDRDPAKLDVPVEAQFFVYFDVVTIETGINGYPVKLEQRLDYTSRVYYYGGQLYSLDEAMSRFDDVDYGREEGSLFFNIRIANDVGIDPVTHVIQQRDGQLNPFREGRDVIVPLPETVPA